MPSFWNREAQRFRHLGKGTRRATAAQPGVDRDALERQISTARSGQPVSVRTTGYSGVPGVDPRTGGGPIDRRGAPLVPIGQPPPAPGAAPPPATIAGAVGMYPYNTPLTSPNFPGQQFKYSDTGSAPGIRSGTTFDIATASRSGPVGMNSPYVNQSSAQFSPGINQIQQATYNPAPYEPSSVSVPPFSQNIGINLGAQNALPSGNFGAQPLPTLEGYQDQQILQNLPPFTDLGLDASSFMASSGGGGALPDSPASPFVGISGEPVTNISGDPLNPISGVGSSTPPSATEQIGSQFNYSPAPNGGTYVYDANWNYMSTIPGQDSGSTSTSQTAQSTPTSSTPSSATTSYSVPVSQLSPVSGTDPYFAQTAGSNYYGSGGNTFGYGGTTSFSSGSTGLYGGFEGGTSYGVGALGELGLGGTGMPMGFGPRLL